MKNIIRNTCIMCNGRIRDIYTLKNFPIYMGVSYKNSEDLYSDKIFSLFIFIYGNDINLLISIGVRSVTVPNLNDPFT